MLYHQLKAINIDAFKADIENSDLMRNPKSNAIEPAQQYKCPQHSHRSSHPACYQKDLPQTSQPMDDSCHLGFFKIHHRYLEHVLDILSASGVDVPTALNRSQLSRYTSAIDRCQRQNLLTISKLLLNTVAIIYPYGKHLRLTPMP